MMHSFTIRPLFTLMLAGGLTGSPFLDKSITAGLDVKTTQSALPGTLYEKNSGCEKGVQEAKADEKKGIIGYYFWGIATPPVAYTLANKYGFRIYTKGCVMTAEEGKAWSCYNEYMKEVIKRTYKQDVIAIEIAREHEKGQERLRQQAKDAPKKS